MYMCPCRELVSAVDYLHSNLIMHGDLKPDNLLLSADGRLTVSDFGSATVLVSKQCWLCTTAQQRKTAATARQCDSANWCSWSVQITAAAAANAGNISAGCR